ncbi:MAG: hypothetical protein OYG31_02750 [Candidatus Kaiserbacteria bacterium]|nr:hypothetical protein [Candidatus Kaiserbacteria bacterium]
MFSLLIASFVAGFLTILAPCLLPLVPAVIGSAASGESRRSPFLTIASLLVAIIIVTVIIQIVPSLFYVPSEFWNYLAAILIFFVGLAFVVPQVWSKIPFVATSATGSSRLLGRLMQRSGPSADITVGAALAPAFTSCSPTYLLIIAVILPASFLQGLLYLTAYVLGLGTVLIGIALIGRSLLQKLDLLSHGWFKISIGVILIGTSIIIATGLEKSFATFLLDRGFFDVTTLELID